MSLICYLDDSGNNDDPIITLAGYISPAHDWCLFELEARALFDEWELLYLHTVELHQRKGQFKDWTRDQAATFANRFFSILHRNTYAGFEFSVHKSTFEAKKSIYNLEQQSSPLGFCFHGIIHRLVNDESIKDALSLPGIDLSFVVEAGNKHEEEVQRRFNKIQRQDPNRFSTLRFVPKKEKIALQAADFFAYFSRRLRVRSTAAKHYRTEVQFFETATGEMPHHHFLATDFGG